MSLPTLADLKRHLRIRHNMDDEDLQEKLDAAIDQASEFLNRPIPWPVVPETDPVEYADVPPSVRAAIMLGAGELYAQRERAVVGTIYAEMPTWRNLLNPYRVCLGV
ncbi:Phage gp6-like head-tail connector protein [compost metagenome]